MEAPLQGSARVPGQGHRPRGRSATLPSQRSAEATVIASPGGAVDADGERTATGRADHDDIAYVPAMISTPRTTASQAAGDGVLWMLTCREQLMMASSGESVDRAAFATTIWPAQS